MSISASGTFGGSMTFASWKGRAYVRQHVIPSNPKSAKQSGVRAMMSFLTKAWSAIAALSQATWEELAAQTNISDFNAFVSHNLQRWQSSLSPTQANPAAEASSALTVSTQTLTGGDGMVTVQLTPSGGTSIWGFIICRDLAEITAPSWANAVAVVNADGANQVTYVDSPLDAGTYHYRAAAFNTDGKLGAFHADGTATAS
jgi:hypothetical protein